MYGTSAVQGTYLTVDAAFVRHITSQVEEKRKRLSCIVEGKRCLLQHTVQTDTSLAQEEQ